MMVRRDSYGKAVSVEVINLIFSSYLSLYDIASELDGR
jgi:hypothetical protein